MLWQTGGWRRWAKKNFKNRDDSILGVCLPKMTNTRLDVPAKDKWKKKNAYENIQNEKDDLKKDNDNKAAKGAPNQNKLSTISV